MYLIINLLNHREDLTNKFDYDLENKIEFERVKCQLELDRIINKEQLLKSI